MSVTPDFGHFLDHASSSPLRPAARDAMVAAFDEALGDPSRMHEPGLRARGVLEDARDRVAAFFGTRGRQVVFTSGATEAITAACWGLAERGTQIVAAVEHSAVRFAATQFGPVVGVGCDGFGRIDPAEVLDAIGPDTGGVHVQLANHEVGTVQPVAEIVSECRMRGVAVHVDAAQAVGRMPIDLADLGADLVSMSGHKVGGPAGTGALLVRRGKRFRSLLVGGDQERARRAGLENVAGACGLAAALTELDVAAESATQVALSAQLRAVLAEIEGVTMFGHPSERLPHLVCAGISDVEPQAVLLGLDRRGIRAHSGSACASEGLEPSPVLEAMGVDAHRSLRLSLGWSSVQADVDAVAAVLPGVIADLRTLRRG